jgi:ParB family chromosome partitioning protein
MLRLLRLPDEVQILLAERRLNMGHARAILGLPTIELQQRIAEKAASQGLSVRQVERLVQRMSEPREPGDPTAEQEDANVKVAVAILERVLGTRVRIISKSAQRGRMEIEYYTQDELNRIFEFIVGKEEQA